MNDFVKKNWEQATEAKKLEFIKEYFDEMIVESTFDFGYSIDSRIVKEELFKHYFEGKTQEEIIQNTLMITFKVFTETWDLAHGIGYDEGHDEGYDERASESFDDID